MPGTHLRLCRSYSGRETQASGFIKTSPNHPNERGKGRTIDGQPQTSDDEGLASYWELKVIYSYRGKIT